jgi:hypothetical protein
MQRYGESVPQTAAVFIDSVRNTIAQFMDANPESTVRIPNFSSI